MRGERTDTGHRRHDFFESWTKNPSDGRSDLIRSLGRCPTMRLAWCTGSTDRTHRHRPRGPLERPRASPTPLARAPPYAGGPAIRRRTVMTQNPPRPPPRLHARRARRRRPVGVAPRAAAAVVDGCRGPAEPNAMVLSTVDGEGRPTSRTVLLRGSMTTARCGFFNQPDSRKGQSAGGNSAVSILFPW